MADFPGVPTGRWAVLFCQHNLPPGVETPGYDKASLQDAANSEISIRMAYVKYTAPQFELDSLSYACDKQLWGSY